MDPIDEYANRIKSENLAAARDIIGYFVAGKDPDGHDTYFNLAMAEGVVFPSPDRCVVWFPSGRRAEFNTVKEVEAIRRLVDRAAAR